MYEFVRIYILLKYIGFICSYLEINFVFNSNQRHALINISKPKILSTLSPKGRRMRPPNEPQHTVKITFFLF